jgi:hypothetical protein
METEYLNNRLPSEITRGAIYCEINVISCTIRLRNIFQLNANQCEFQLTIKCPFCNASEDERISGVDENGKKVMLLLFDCPFFYRLPIELLASDDSIQNYLNEWRTREGDSWLESIGPILKVRELKNIDKLKLVSS